MYFLKVCLGGKQRVEAGRNLVRDDLGEHKWYRNWDGMRGYLQNLIIGSEVRGDICVLDEFNFTSESRMLFKTDRNILQVPCQFQTW